MKTESKSNSSIKRPAATCGKWALGILIILFVLPLFCFLAFEIFHIRTGDPYFSLNFILIIVFGGLPGSFVSLALGIVGINRDEHPIKLAMISVALSILPVLCGLWVLKNLIMIGEPW